MSQDPQQQIERDDASSIYEADPILGNYLSHHPSNRIRLTIIGAVLYAIPVGILQLLFFNVENDIAAIFLPVAYAAIAGGIFWFMLHNWNREVVLYERGFSYRQGSTTAYILYANVIKLIQNIEGVSFLGLSRTVYDYKLITDIEETLTINNVYSDPERLTRALDAYVARDRLAIMRRKLEDGTAAFGGGLQLTQAGILFEDRELFWHEFKSQRVKNGQFYIQSHDNDEWAVVPVSEIDNPVLLIALLKERGQIPTETR